jgi:uncharacterized protein YbjT (DUF2867 family)
MTPPQEILLLGAGELGAAFLPHLASLPQTQVTIGVRTPSKYEHLSNDRDNVSLLSLDTNEPSEELSQIFAKYDTIISCTGFGQSPEILTKLAEEILEAGRLRAKEEKSRLWFFPWQWGVDYDVTGDADGLMPLFGEQVKVRNLLRETAARSNVKWTILSTGIFMSFLFEQFWGIVDREDGNIKVRALRNWDHKVTVTDVEDIGKCLARVVAGDVESENRIVYAAGDTVSYSQLADIVERVIGKKAEREEWSIPYLTKELAEDPDNLIRRYRVVFAGDGVWWDKELTVNHKLGLPVTDVESYTKKIL